MSKKNSYDFVITVLSGWHWLTLEDKMQENTGAQLIMGLEAQLQEVSWLLSNVGVAIYSSEISLDLFKA